MILAEIQNDPITWAQLGIAGAIVLAAVRGLVWFKPAVDALRSDLAETKQELRNLQEIYTKAVVPALTTANRLVEKALDLERGVEPPKPRQR